MNGKKRADIVCPPDTPEATIKEVVLGLDAVQKALDGREARKVIVVPGRIVNVVG